METTVAKWLGTVEAWEAAQEWNRLNPESEHAESNKSMMMAWAAARSCHGTEELSGIAESQGGRGLTAEWFRQHRGQLILQGWAPEVVDALPVPDFACEVAKLYAPVDAASPEPPGPQTHWGVLNVMIDTWQGDVDDAEERKKIFQEYNATYAGKPRKYRPTETYPELDSLSQLGGVIRNCRKSAKKTTG